MNISVLLLSWNILDVLKISVERMMKESLDIWIVDNGSTDGSHEWLKKCDDSIHTILLPENMGSSVARNQIIEKFSGDYLLMLDGDIAYISGSARGLLNSLIGIPDAYVLGINYNNMTNNLSLAHDKWDGPGEIKDTIPVAFTQYGLFKGDLIRKNNFPIEGPFGKPGWGAEDDFVHGLMLEAGYKSYHCNKPIYYHRAHSGAIQLAQKGMDLKKNRIERVRFLLQRFPHYPIKIVEQANGELIFVYL